jgi:hypothetical protein
MQVRPCPAPPLCGGAGWAFLSKTFSFMRKRKYETEQFELPITVPTVLRLGDGKFLAVRIKIGTPFKRNFKLVSSVVHRFEFTARRQLK